jgi:hypothetical protein
MPTSLEPSALDITEPDADDPVWEDEDCGWCMYDGRRKAENILRMVGKRDDHRSGWWCLDVVVQTEIIRVRRGRRCERREEATSEVGDQIWRGVSGLGIRQLLETFESVGVVFGVGVIWRGVEGEERRG